MLLCKVSDLWSFKIKVPMLTYLKQTQLSNPQKYKFDFIEKENEKKAGGEGSELSGFG